MFRSPLVLACVGVAALCVLSACKDSEPEVVYVSAPKYSTTYKPLRVEEGSGSSPSTFVVLPSSAEGTSSSNAQGMPRSNTLNSFNVDRRVEQLSQSAQGREVLREFIDDNGGVEGVLGSSQGSAANANQDAGQGVTRAAATVNAASVPPARLLGGVVGAPRPSTQLTALPANNTLGNPTPSNQTGGTNSAAFTSPYVSLDSVSASATPPLNQRPLGTNAQGPGLTAPGGTQAYETNRAGVYSPTTPSQRSNSGVLSPGVTAAPGTLANPGASGATGATSFSPTIP